MEVPNAERGLDVVIVYAFDCTTKTPAWNKMDEVYWMMHDKLTDFAGSRLGYVYVMSTPNTYTCDMKLVDSRETAATGYKQSPLWRRTACTENMASGLKEAHKLISDGNHLNAGVILFFHDGSVTKGDYFDGTETFVSTLPVHILTLAGDAYNEGFHMVTARSPGGTYNRFPDVPDKPNESASFSHRLDIILRNAIKINEISGKAPQNVFIVYAFDSTTSTPAYKKVDEIFWMVHKELTKSVDTSLGYIYVMSTPNTYTLDMKLVDPTDKDGSYKGSSAWRRTACTKNMASGLYLANEFLSNHGKSNSIILLFADGLGNMGDFFDGSEGFISKFPVHTFTVDGDADSKILRIITANSGGTFNPLPVPDQPNKSASFWQRLGRILTGTVDVENYGREQYQDVIMRNLYLYQTDAVPNADESSMEYADFIINSGPIYEGLSPNATLVARVQGPNISAGDSPDMLTIVFETARFKGSTLRVSGSKTDESWLVYGGTGRFSMVEGRINAKMQESRSDGNVIGLTINLHVFHLP